MIAIESQVFDTDTNELLGKIWTDGQTVRSVGADDTPNKTAYSKLASYFHQYATTLKDGETLPHSEIVYEALLKGPRHYTNYFIKTSMFTEKQ